MSDKEAMKTAGDLASELTEDLLYYLQRNPPNKSIRLILVTGIEARDLEWEKRIADLLSYQDEIAQLRADLAALQTKLDLEHEARLEVVRENEGLKTDLAAWVAYHDAKVETCQQLRNELATLKTELEAARERIYFFETCDSAVLDAMAKERNFLRAEVEKLRAEQRASQIITQDTNQKLEQAKAAIGGEGKE